MIPIEKRIQQMLNKELMYGMRLIVITGYEINQERERIYLHSNIQQNHFDRSISDCGTLLDNFKTVERKDVAVIDQSTAMMANVSNMETLESTLMDSIELLKKDPNYIKQATAINNNVNTLVNISKMKLDFFKMAMKVATTKS